MKGTVPPSPASVRTAIAELTGMFAWVDWNQVSKVIFISGDLCVCHFFGRRHGFTVSANFIHSEHHIPGDVGLPAVLARNKGDVFDNDHLRALAENFVAFYDSRGARAA